MPSALIGLFFLLVPGASAAEFSEHELILKQEGSSLVSELILEREAFNAVVVQTEKDIDGLMVDFGNGWEAVEIH